METFHSQATAYQSISVQFHRADVQLDSDGHAAACLLQESPRATWAQCRSEIAQLIVGMIFLQGCPCSSAECGAFLSIIAKMRREKL